MKIVVIHFLFYVLNLIFLQTIPNGLNDPNRHDNITGLNGLKNVQGRNPYNYSFIFWQKR